MMRARKKQLLDSDSEPDSDSGFESSSGSDSEPGLEPERDDSEVDSEVAELLGLNSDSSVASDSESSSESGSEVNAPVSGELVERLKNLAMVGAEVVPERSSRASQVTVPAVPVTAPVAPARASQVSAPVAPARASQVAAPPTPQSPVAPARASQVAAPQVSQSPARPSFIPPTQSKYQTPSRLTITRPPQPHPSRYDLGTPELTTSSRSAAAPVAPMAPTQSSTNPTIQPAAVQAPMSPITPALVPGIDGLSIDKLRASTGRGGYSKNELKTFADQLGVATRSSDNKKMMVDRILSRLGY